MRLDDFTGNPALISNNLKDRIKEAAVAQLAFALSGSSITILNSCRNPRILLMLLRTLIIRDRMDSSSSSAHHQRSPHHHLSMDAPQPARPIQDAKNHFAVCFLLDRPVNIWQ